jgi:hypothetical protein
MDFISEINTNPRATLTGLPLAFRSSRDCITTTIGYETTFRLPRHSGESLGQTINNKPSPEPDEQPTSVKPSSSETRKFSKKRLVLAFAIAAVSDAIGAFATPLPPIVWVVDIGTALLLFVVLGRQWMLLPGLALEAIPGLGVLPFWLLVVGAVALLGTPRPKFERP